jgi:lipoprotein-anchoring transpeptidase ErfK/SrfK
VSGILMKAEIKNPKKSNTGLPEHHHHSVILMAVLVLFLVIASGAIAWFYKDRALPNVVVGKVPVGQVARAQIQEIVEQQAASMKVSFMDGAKATTVAAKDLGVTVDTSATVNQTLQARKHGDVLARVQLWQAQQVPLVLHNDAGALKDYIKQHFPTAFVDAKDARMVYNENTNQFDIQPSTTGKGFDIKSFETTLPSLASQPRTMDIALSTVPTQPLISSEALVPIQAEANQRLSLALQFMLNGTVAYSAKASDIASWMHFMPDPTKGTVRIEYDKAKIQQFIDQQVASSVTTTPVDRKIVIDPASGAQTVLQKGSSGRQIQDTDKLADSVKEALTNNQPFAKEVAIVDAPFKTVTMTGTNKWVEVDLSKQTTTLYVGDTAIRSFLISSGAAASPTIPGEYHVWLKVASQTMTERSNVTSGDYFYLPNVKWVSYFDGGRAFHGTYWHHNFGHPMSHGCINMTEDDAKIVYDFAPVGTKVIVHA